LREIKIRNLKPGTHRKVVQQELTEKIETLLSVTPFAPVGFPRLLFERENLLPVVLYTGDRPGAGGKTFGSISDLIMMSRDTENAVGETSRKKRDMKSGIRNARGPVRDLASRTPNHASE
jgi:hypothetical protein